MLQQKKKKKVVKDGSQGVARQMNETWIAGL